MLLTGFFDRYDRLKMAVFESNAEWLAVHARHHATVYFKLYASERGPKKSDRLPSEAFTSSASMSFESDEKGVFRQWDHYENIGIWASDAYHHDGADSWSAMRNMNKAGVPAEVSARSCSGATPGGCTASSRRCSSPTRPRRSSVPTGSLKAPSWRSSQMVAHPREHVARVGARWTLKEGRRLARTAGSAVSRGSLLMAEVVDIDSHVYEPAAIWDEYVPPGDRGMARAGLHHNVDDQGNSTTVLNGQSATRSSTGPDLVRQAIWQSGNDLESIGAWIRTSSSP